MRAYRAEKGGRETRLYSAIGRLLEDMEVWRNGGSL